jgi:hypothetical protein
MGANNADFHGIQLTHEYNDDYGDISSATVKAVHPTEGEVGRMYLADEDNTGGKTHKVMNISVKEPHRRKGIATAMWKYAKAVGLNPRHDYWEQSDEGAAWAKAVGD